MSDTPPPPPAQRYGIFSYTGSGIAAGSGAGLDRKSYLGLRRGPVREYLLVDMSEQVADWVRLLAEQLVGDPAHCQISGFTVGPSMLGTGGTITWTAEPTEDVAIAITALQERDTPTLLRMTGGQ